jgi:hypothetical protein
MVFSANLPESSFHSAYLVIRSSRITERKSSFPDRHELEGTGGRQNFEEGLYFFSVVVDIGIRIATGWE